MDGMLSQDEINALLNGMDLSNDDTTASSEPANLTQTADMTVSGVAGDSSGDEVLTDVEKDAIGEVANISMGSSATTMYSLVNRKVNITTPVVTLSRWSSILEAYEKPCVFIQINYTKGLDGTNILVLKEHDVKVITDLMMGGDGTNIEGELGELHLSAISEAMNQMMGASATSLSTMLNTMIDISPPESSLLDLAQFETGGEIAPFLAGEFVRISFRMQIGDLVDSSIMQIYPIEFAKNVVDIFFNSQMSSISGPEPEPAPAPAAPQSTQTPPPQAGGAGTPMGMPANGMAPNGMDNGMGGMPMGDQMGNPMNGNPMMGNPMNGMPMNGMPMNGVPMNGMPMQGNPMMGNPMMGMPMMGMPMNGMPMNGVPMQNTNIQLAQFQNFSNDASGIQGQENIGLIMDVPLEVTVELGRTVKSISEILNFAPGTIIELDRIAGEPIDVLVNGKFVAKGEVVVIEESFGIRVTEIIK